MTQNDLKVIVQKKYGAGQTITMRERNQATNEVIRKFKVKVIELYPNCVLVQVGANKESYSYHDMVRLTTAEGKKE